MKKKFAFLFFIFSFSLWAQEVSTQGQQISAQEKKVSAQEQQAPAVGQKNPVSENKAVAQEQEVPAPTAEALSLSSSDAVHSGMPVMSGGKVLFYVHSPLGNFSPAERASAIAERLNQLKSSPQVDINKLKIITSEVTTDIVYDSFTIMSITPQDAESEKKLPEDLAKDYIAKISTLFEKPKITIASNPNDLYILFKTHRENLLRSALAFLAFLLFMAATVVLAKIFSKLYKWLESLKGIKLKSISFKGYEVVSDSALVLGAIYVFKAIRLFLIIILFYLFVSGLFVLFPWAKSAEVMEIIKGVLLTIFSAGITFALYKAIKVGMNALKENVSHWKGVIIKPLKIKTVNVLSEEQIVQVLKKIIVVLGYVVNLFLLYLLIPIVFSFFEFTSNWASTLFNYILAPLKAMFSALFHYLPNLFFIAVIIFITRYIIQLTKLFFDAVEEGNITFANFHQDWAETTYKIVRSLILILTAIVIFPYFPGSQSEAFKGVSLFLGVLFSLGSTSVIANVVAGIILTYMYAFKIGDKVKIENTVGKVIEKTILVTRIQTITNIIITIPNATVIGSHIINYTTSSARGDGLVLTTVVKLGYNTPWRLVHQTLIEAALTTKHVKHQPPPFVLQVALDDFAVAYELNCITNQPNYMAEIYSELHQNIQDKCNEAGIEIMTPHYVAARDGNDSTMPPEYLAPTYQAPAFALKIVQGLKNFPPKS